MAKREAKVGTTEGRRDVCNLFVPTSDHLKAQVCENLTPIPSGIPSPQGRRNHRGYPLTRRRDPNARQESWRVLYCDVRVGTIADYPRALRLPPMQRRITDPRGAPLCRRHARWKPTREPPKTKAELREMLSCADAAGFAFRPTVLGTKGERARGAR
jgi:hypothetical protein